MDGKMRLKDDDENDENDDRRYKEEKSESNVLLSSSCSPESSESLILTSSVGSYSKVKQPSIGETADRNVQMGRTNFKPSEMVTCLTASERTSSPLESAANLGQCSPNVQKKCPSTDSTKSSSLSSASSSSVTSTTSTVTSVKTSTSPLPCLPYHPHHYHHHRHHPSTGTQYASPYTPHNSTTTRRYSVYGPSELVTKPDSPKLTSNRSKSAAAANDDDNNNDTSSYSIYLGNTKSSFCSSTTTNNNPLGLPDWSSSKIGLDITAKCPIAKSKVQSPSSVLSSAVSNSKQQDSQQSMPVDETILITTSSTTTTQQTRATLSSPSSSSFTLSHHHHHHLHHHSPSSCSCSSSSSSHRTHLPSPRKSKKISSRSWLHRSSSDPALASSSVTYSAHTSALLLTTGAYPGSPSTILSPKTITSSTPSPTPPLATVSSLSSTVYNNSPSSPTTPLYLSTPYNTSLSSSTYPVPLSTSNVSPSPSPSPPLPPPCLETSSTRHLTGSPFKTTSSHRHPRQHQHQHHHQPNESKPHSPTPITTSSSTTLTSKQQQLVSPCSPSSSSSLSSPGASSASQFFSSQMSSTKRCVLRLDGYSYLIVANPPETKVTKDAHLEPNRPSETIVTRRAITKPNSGPWKVDSDSLTKQPGATTATNLPSESTTMDTLPPVDTVEACDKAAARLRELAQHLDHGEVPISILKKTLQYAACVLDTVTMDETRKCNRPGLIRRKGLGPRAPSDPTPPPPPLTKSLSLCGPGSPSPRSHGGSSSVNPSSLLTSTLKPNSVQAMSSCHTDSSSHGTLSLNKTIPTSSISRKILDEEDDLSEVQPDAVPNEVREWLASTFTRNNTAQKRRSEEKPKFRSVANAIRAGIMVDRLYRRLCCSNMVQIPPKIADRLKSIDNWSYDCFKLNEASNNQVLKYISYELLNRYGLVHKFKIPLETLESCLNQFEQGYTKFKNPYHNNIHAADVTQTVHYMLSKMGLVNWLTDLEIFATLLAAIIHDFQHTGTTNNFHVMSESETALLYNDRAVLENFHVSAAFRILKESDCNILVNLNKEEYRELRTLVIDMVLATDMSSHFQQIKTMKSLLSNPNEFTVDKSKALSLVLHCCDISHPSKQWDIHRRWTELLLEEFFRQGDKERELGLPYSPLCDRNTTLVAESQIGFIDFIVAPSLEVCGDLLDKIYQHLEGCRHSSGSSEESLEETRLPENASRPKSLSTYKNKRGGLSIDSVDTSLNSRPVASAPASPRFSHCSSFGNCKIEGGRLKRSWADNLEENRKRWQERAALDAIQREKNAKKQSTDGISLSMSPESEL